MHNRYTDGSYTSLNPDFNDSESVVKAISYNRILARNRISLNNLLDFGCGGGGVLRSLNVPSGSKFVGYDINKDAVDYASQNNTSANLIFTTDRLYLKSVKYNCISFIHVLEHLPNWEDILLSLCSSSDYIYISIPLEASVWHTLRPNVLKNQYLKYGHIHFFNKSYFVYRLEELGFDIIDLDFSDEFRSFNSFKSKLISYPRRFLGFFSKSFASNLLGGYCLQVLIKKS